LVGGIPMQNRLRLAALLALALVFPLRALSAQEVLRTDRLPVGFAVTAVSDGGRYLTLQDGRVWEVEISDRATTGSWGAGDFVAVGRHAVGYVGRSGSRVNRICHPERTREILPGNGPGAAK
jgi:hypothetical protein